MGSSHAATRAVSLDALLRGGHHVTAECLDVRTFTDLFLPWPVPGISTDLAPLSDLHPSTVAALGLCRSHFGQQIQAIHLYTDGSFESGLASWAVVVIAELSTGSFAFLGYLAGKVVTDEATRGFIGATVHTNGTAEMSAILWALLWVMQCPPLRGMSVEVHMDSTYAGGIAALATQARVNRALAQLTQTLAVIAARFAHVTFLHVKAHSGHPWNEMVDRVASAAHKGRIAGLQVDLPVKSWFQGNALKSVALWSQILAYNPEHRAAYPPQLGGRLVVTPPAHSLPARRVVELSFPVQRPREKTDALPLGQTIVFATANVLTLAPGDVREAARGLMVSGRVALLQTQFHNQGVHMVGVQEARTPGPDIRASDKYCAITSGATHRGTHGCELWINTRIPFASVGGQKVFFQPRNAAVVAHSPTYLYVAIRMHGFVLDCVVAHAPHGRPDPRVAEVWWERFAAIVLRRRTCGIPVVVLVDANARLGSTGSESVGTCCAQAEDPPGEFFHQFMHDTASCVPSTFEQYHVGGSNTWRSSAGYDHRLDYVVVPKSWRDRSMRSFVCHDIDLSTRRDDHFPVLLSVPWAHLGNDGLCKRRTVELDRRKLSDPAAVQAFLADVSTIPHVPWSWDVHSHLAMVNHKVRELLVTHFPLSTPAPRRPWISEATCSIVSARCSVKSELRRANRHARHANMLGFFRAWRALLAPAASLSRAMPVFSSAECNRNHDSNMVAAFAMASLDASHPALKHSIKRDKIVFFERLAETATQAAQDNDQKTLHRVVRSMSAYKRKAAPALMNTSGEFLATPLAIRERWQEFFAGKSGGAVRDLDAILADTQGLPRDADVLPDLGNVPTFHEIAGAFAKVAAHKAVGEDTIPGDVLKLAPGLMASLYHPIYVKAALRTTEPFQWRGGMLVELYKQRGSTADCESYRDISVSDSLGKVAHRAMRNRAFAAYKEYAGELQFGHLGTDFASHLLREIIAYAAHKKLSMALLFIDIVGAFAAVLRQLAIGHMHSDGDVARLVAKLGFKPEVMHDLARAISGPSALEEASHNRHLNAMIADAHRCTWFTTQGLSTAVHTTLGSRAGDPFGDLVFGFLLARVSREVNEALSREGLQFSLPTAGVHEPLFTDAPCPQDTCVRDIQYVDDDVFPFVHKDPEQIVDQLARAIPIVVDIFASHALVLNFKPGKSEVLLAIRGKGSTAVRRRTLLAHPPAILAVTRALGNINVRVVHMYKHLGGIVVASGNLVPEVSSRCKSAMAAFQPIVRKIFAAPWLPTEVRMSLASSLVTSRLTFNAATWSALSEVATAKLHTVHLRVLRRVAGRTPHHGALRDNVADQAVLGELRAPNVKQILMRLRLCYYPRVLQGAPGSLLAALTANASTHGSWVEQLKCDMHSVWRSSGKLRELPDPHLDAGAWREFVSAFPKQWRSIVTAATAYVAQPACDQPALANCEVASSFPCYECGQAFVSRAAVATHAFQKHGYQNPARRFAHGTSCPCCMREFWTRLRLIHHLSCSSKACLSRVMGIVPPLSQEVQHDLDKQDTERYRQSRASGFHPMFADRPSVVLQGPSLVP